MGSKGTGQSGEALERKLVEDIKVVRKLSSDDKEGETTLESSIESSKTVEETKESSEADIKLQGKLKSDEGDVPIQKKASSTLNDASDKVKKDSGAILKQEFINLRESMRIIKTFGIDWILEWIKTKNFKYWLKNHESIVGQRSMNSRWAFNHIWYYENGDIYFGELRGGRRHGKVARML